LRNLMVLKKNLVISYYSFFLKKKKTHDLAKIPLSRLNSRTL